MNPGLLGLYWDARQQSLDECADRCFRTLQAMRDADFDGFFQRGRSRKDALGRAFEVTPAAVRLLLGHGVNRRDDNREPIPELGWSLGLWSGRPDGEAFNLNIHCGSFSKWVGNNVALTLPPDGPHSLKQGRAQAEQLFEQLVAVWQPEQAILCHTDELRWENGRIPADVVALKRCG
jgi:hypothetical protein